MGFSTSDIPSQGRWTRRGTLRWTRWWSCGITLQAVEAPVLADSRRAGKQEAPLAPATLQDLLRDRTPGPA
jgi:hypothetical protein